ncbi:non-ribosomal peptide synthetase [Catenulispora pinisilvae]|uniref:non-ribosomal peptide synthetase n=1 Tax=Catenulispora pinisilvae TaxID=2705253 RepID=UPI0018919D67|nr:non-ribosomal peptide synthetase [Catenulispora pinisilvae]
MGERTIAMPASIDAMPVSTDSTADMLSHSSVAGPVVKFDDGMRIEGFLAAQVSAQPDRTAVTSRDGALSYRELDRRANQLARGLQENGVARGDLVAVAVERSLEMLVSIVAVLKAGAAYVPVDLSYPAARIQYILDDCAAKVVLARPGSIPPGPGATTVIDPFSPASYSDDHSALGQDLDSGDLAYVIYTSGSTGKPKGVMVEHRAVVNRLLWMQRAYPLGSDDVILQKTPIAFDVSGWELFWWLIPGASVHLLEPGGEKDPDAIASTIASRHVTTLHFVPSMLHVFLDYLEATSDRLDQMSSLWQVFTSGEALTTHQVRRFHSALGPSAPALVNLYGPTEAAIDVTHHACSDREPALVPLGRPIDNIRLYVLNQDLSPVQPGGTGELCIAGVGLARGYVRRPELTRERFIDHPFPGESRIYRTGDLARLLPDGTFEYLGRNDDQVKIRGVRIELGEIESALRDHAGVTAAVAIARRTSEAENLLYGYVVGPAPVALTALREHLCRVLPPVAVPSHLMQLDQLPLTANGKLDRAALPEPAPAEPSTSRKQQRPWAELVIGKAWAKVLGVQVHDIKATDNFYDLGGTSIGMVRVATELGGLLTLRDLMERSEFGLIVQELERRQVLQRQIV